jgi:DNA-binding protein HU-beta
VWRPRGDYGVTAGKEVKRLTKAELIDQVTRRSGLKKKDVTVVVESVFGTMSACLKEHEKVQIVGFGTFEPRRRRARIGRDPRTQEAIRIGPSWSLVFRPGKQLKCMVAGKAAPGHPSAKANRGG